MNVDDQENRQPGVLPPASTHPLDSHRLKELLAFGPAGETHLLHAAATGDSLSQLTLGMAHELNNLVGGISALSEIYLQGIESGLPLKDGMGLIHNSAGRLQKLLRQLTEINRKPVGERAYLNLTDMVRGEMELFAHLLPKSVRIDTALPSGELAVLLDETALRQILLNLMLNLRDLMGRDRAAGTITVVIERLPGSEPRAEIRLCPLSANRAVLPPAADEDGLSRLESRLRFLDADESTRLLGGNLELRGEDFVLTLSLIA